MAASTAVKFAPDAAGRVAGNLPSGIVPEARLDALSVSKLAPEPLNVVAVIIPVILTLPVPVISLLLRSKSPPSCGVVSVTTSGITPERLVRAEPSPLNAVAVKVPLAELNVRLDPLLRAKLPVAAVVNIGKQVVSLDSSATGIVVAAW